MPTKRGAKKRTRDAVQDPVVDDNAMPPLPGDDAPAVAMEEVAAEVADVAMADPEAVAMAAAAAEAVTIAALDPVAAAAAAEEPAVEEPETKRVKSIVGVDLGAGGPSKRAENWNAKFEELKAFKETNGHFHLPKKESLSQWARDQRTQYAKGQRGVQSTLTVDRRAALESIGFPWRLWTKKSWEERISELEAFKDQNGHCDVPIRRDTPQSLATWVDEQRKLYRYKQKGKKNALTDEREQQLEAMGFSWYRYGPTSWEDRVKELKAYKEEHGDCLVPLKFKNEKGSPWKRLANWVSFQRLQYKNMTRGKKTLMTEERRKELEDIGFVFNIKEDNPYASWNLMLDELYRFKSQSGNCNVPAVYDANKRLAAWVRWLRSLYHSKTDGDDTSGLTDERIAILDGMDFDWTVTDEGEDALDNSEFFAAFAQAEAEDKSKPKYAGKGATGFARNDGSWNSKLDILKRYKEDHGHCNVAWKGKNQQGDKDLAQLGKWVSKQRSEYRKLQAGKKSQITQPRIDALNELGFDWSPGSVMVDWGTRLQQLQAYKDEHGNTNVPKSYQENPSLGQWVQTQRVYYKRLKAGKQSHLTEERRQQLDAIGFQWNVTGGGRKTEDEEAVMDDVPPPPVEDNVEMAEEEIADVAAAAAAAAAEETLQAHSASV